MGLSTGRDLHIDSHLTSLAINYRPQNMIADMVAPVLPSEKQSDSYPVFSRFEFFSVEDAERAPKTEAKKIQRSVSSAQYMCKNYALGYDVPVEDQANMDATLRFEMDTGASQFLVSKLYLAKEKRVITLAVNTTNVSTVFVVNSSWGVAANAGDPMVAVEQAKEYMRSLTGQLPNSMLWGYSAWSRTRRNTNMRNLIKGTNNGGGFVTREQAREIFEVDRMLVAEALWHTKNEALGVGTPNFMPMSLTNPLDDSIILYYAPPAPSRNDPSWMYGFDWRGPGLPARFTVFRHPYDSRRRIDGIEVTEYADERITGVDYAVRIVTNAASGAAGLGA